MKIDGKKIAEKMLEKKAEEAAKKHNEAYLKKISRPVDQGFTDEHGHVEEPLHPDQHRVNEEVLAALEAGKHEEAHKILKKHREKMDRDSRR